MVIFAVDVGRRRMRFKSDGLQALVRHAMGREPFDGALYVIVNRRATQRKCLYFDRSGFLHLGEAARGRSVRQ